MGVGGTGGVGGAGPSSAVGGLVGMGVDPGLAAAAVAASNSASSGPAMGSATPGTPGMVGSMGPGLSGPTDAGYGGPSSSSGASNGHGGVTGSPGGTSGGAQAAAGPGGIGSGHHGFGPGGLGAPAGVGIGSSGGGFSGGFGAANPGLGIGSADSGGGYGSAAGSSKGDFGGHGINGFGSAMSGTKADFGAPSIGSAMFGSTVGKNSSSGYGGRGRAAEGRSSGRDSRRGRSERGYSGPQSMPSDRGRAVAGLERASRATGYSGPQSMPSDRGFAVAQLGPSLGNAVADLAARRGHSAFGFGDHPMSQPTDLAGIRSADTHSKRQAALNLAAMNALAPTTPFTAAMNQLGPQALAALVAREGITEGPSGMAGIMASMMNRAMAQESGYSRHLGNINNMADMYSALKDLDNTVSAPVGSKAFNDAVRAAILGTQQTIPAVPSEVQNATHYFNPDVRDPSTLGWAKDATFTFGDHRFGNTAPAPSASRMAAIRGERYGGLGGTNGGMGGRGR